MFPGVERGAKIDRYNFEIEFPDFYNDLVIASSAFWKNGKLKQEIKTMKFEKGETIPTGRF